MAAIFDVDGVLFKDGTLLFFEWAASQGLKWSYEAYVASGNDWFIATGLEKHGLDPLYAEFSSSCLDSLHHPMPGAKEGMRRIADLQRYVATARPLELESHSAAELEKHYGDFHGYHFGVKDQKAQVIEMRNGRFLVDDSIKECELVSASHPGVHAILFPMRYRYNTPRIEGIIRLSVEDRIRKGMDDDGWHEVCESAWEEATEIILNTAEIIA